MHTLREQAFLVICVVMNISSMAASRSPHLSSSCLPVSRLLLVIVSLMAVISAAVGLVGMIVVAAQ